MGHHTGAMQYAVVIEKGARSFGAYVPDLPGCVAVAKTRGEVEKLIVEAIEFHLDGLRESGEPIPKSGSDVRLIDVSAGRSSKHRARVIDFTNNLRQPMAKKDSQAPDGRAARVEKLPFRKRRHGG